jgi:multicomponent K+:H+ antiporter subunit D
VVLCVGFFTIVGLARAGVILFWHVQPDPDEAQSNSGSSAKLLSAVWVFMALTLAMAVLASPIKRYADDTAAQLADTAAYAKAVLGLEPGEMSRSLKPYDGARSSRPAPANAKETQ